MATDKSVSKIVRDILDQDPSLVHELQQRKTAQRDIAKKIKSLPKINQKIMAALESEPKAIPQIASEINYPVDKVVYGLMSLRKYGYISETDDIDGDECYLYELKKN